MKNAHAMQHAQKKYNGKTGFTRVEIGSALRAIASEYANVCLAHISRVAVFVCEIRTRLLAEESS
jgi:hypothetical protein